LLKAKANYVRGAYPLVWLEKASNYWYK